MDTEKEQVYDFEQKFPVKASIEIPEYVSSPSEPSGTLPLLRTITGFLGGLFRQGDDLPAHQFVANYFEELVVPRAGRPPEGAIQAKPWEHRITVAIPHIDTLEPLKVAIECLRRQSERPYLMVIDTGSPLAVRAELEALRAPDLEIHFIAGHAYQHSSEPVTAALDLAQTLCRTEYLFHTHSDVFPRRADLLEHLLAFAQRAHQPVVGYRMSPRDWITHDWQWMVGHTATLLHMPTMHRIGATWSMQRMHSQFQVPWRSGEPGWPDTETGFNYCLRLAGIKPAFIGEDTNAERFIDHNIDHARSYPGAKLYAAGTDFAKDSALWILEAMKDACARFQIPLSSFQTKVTT